MLVRSDFAPDGRFSIERAQDKPNFVLIRFYENVRPFTETVEDFTFSGYEYEEYTLELPNTGAMYPDIEANYDVYLRQAKADSDKMTEAEVQTAVKGMEQVLATTDEALIELYEMMLGV